MTRSRSLRLDQDVAKRACRATSCPMPKGLSIYPVIALGVLMQFTWIVAMWASYGESGEHHDMEKPEKSSVEQGYREASLKQRMLTDRRQIRDCSRGVHK